MSATNDDPRFQFRLKDGRPTQGMRWGVVYLAELNLIKDHTCKECEDSRPPHAGVGWLWTHLCALITNRSRRRASAQYFSVVLDMSPASVRRYGKHLEHLGLVRREQERTSGVYVWAITWPEALQKMASETRPVETGPPIDLSMDKSMDKQGTARSVDHTHDHQSAHIEKDSQGVSLINPLTPSEGEPLESEILGMLEVLVASEPVDPYERDVQAWEDFQVSLAQSADARPNVQRKMAARLAQNALGLNYKGRLETTHVLAAARLALKLYQDPNADPTP